MGGAAPRGSPPAGASLRGAGRCLKPPRWFRRIPRWSALIRLAVDGVSSPSTKRAYAAALRQFLGWWEEQGRPPLTRAAVQAWRTQLEEQGAKPGVINQRLAAVRRLAREAAANGLLGWEAAAGIADVPGAKECGTRIGNWLTLAEAQSSSACPTRPASRGRRDRALLGLLLGCGLRRSEAAALTTSHVQQRDGRWVIVDLRGKHGRIRSVAVPAWVKTLVDDWTDAAGVTSGRLLRALDRHGNIGASLSAQAVLDAVADAGKAAGVAIRPHDLRRTCAKLCRSAGAELEQIQFLLGHASVQTTERYLGTRQDLQHAANDFKFRVG